MKSALKKSGFTLIELMVVMAIVAVLAAIVILIINPQEQLKKARDAIRKDDLSKIATALGNYSLDKEGYPLSSADYQIQDAAWGQSWQPYMVKVPQDPLSWQTYSYKSDGKYYQLYAKLENPDANSCAPCGPGGEYNYGITSSTQVALTALPPAPTPGPTPTPIPGSPPPPPSVRYQGSFEAFISSPGNPKMTKLTIDLFDPVSGEQQTVFINAQDSTATITAISVTLRTDKKVNIYPLQLDSGTNTQGTWKAIWNAQDSHETIYNATLTATNAQNQTSSVDVQFEGSLKNARANQQ